MNVVFTILVVLVILASVLVTIVVLLQNGKGGGLASNFAAGNQTFGVRQTADLLEKLTWILAAVILVLSILCSFFTAERNATTIDVTKQIEATTTEIPAFPANTFNAGGEAPATNAADSTAN